MTATDPITRAVERRMCTGCGACAALAPDAIRMVEDPATGLRPVVARGAEAARSARRVASACAGIAADRRPLPVNDALDERWGPVLAVWEAHAADEEIRFRGSSGGAVTALALHLVEAGEVAAVAHVAASADDPRRNEGVVSTDREGLLRGCGSRYAPASACGRLGDIAASDAPHALIGKPCDVASATRARATDPRLSNLAVTIAIFCAGTPSGAGTEALLDSLGKPKGARLVDLAYRGRGWPGPMRAAWDEGEGRTTESRHLTYAEGWGGILQKTRPWRCRICTDHTGVFADVSVGDPWHKPPAGAPTAGRSLVVARSRRGVRLVEDAIRTGRLVAERVTRETLDAAQPNLVDAHASAYGRRLAMRLAALPVPEEAGFPGFRLWWRHLSARRRIASLAGTFRRIAARRLWRPERIAGGEAAR